MEYYPGNRPEENVLDRDKDKDKSKSNLEGSSKSKIVVGNNEGYITIISIDDSRKPFGFRKIRGVLHEIKIEVHSDRF
jgi:hypothetical protein